MDKGVVDVGSAMLFAGGELGFGRWGKVGVPPYLYPVYGRCGGGLVRSLRSRRFFIFSPYKKNEVGELFLLVGAA